MVLLKNNTYLLLIPLILATMYPGWDVKEHNKIRTTENIKNGKIYSLSNFVSRVYSDHPF